MGIAEKNRRAVHVDESTWRKARILAAAFGVPIYRIVTQAIDEMAANHAEEVKQLVDVPRERAPSRRSKRV